MKRTFCVVATLAIMMLEGCTVAPSMLGDNLSGMVNAGASENSSSPNSIAGSINSPGQTGSIVPLRDEGAVVDLPYADRAMQASSAYRDSGFYQGADSQNVGDTAADAEQVVSPSERHRQELINRGDLQEGQPLPIE